MAYLVAEGLHSHCFAHLAFILERIKLLYFLKQLLGPLFTSAAAEGTCLYFLEAVIYLKAVLF